MASEPRKATTAKPAGGSQGRPGAELEELAAEIGRLGKAGKNEARDSALVAYCQLANEQAQALG